ncbi:MAG: sensor histidine kinase, partial [Alphaproteobacteria bacterium]
EAENARVRLVQMPVPAARITLRVDDRAVRQMLLNLLSNAIRYSRPDGSVAVRTEFGQDRSLRIMVEDKGIGIAPEELAFVQQPFERSSRARQHGVGGMGLGLSIVASLIALHDGRLDLASEPGAGTTATLVLPADRVQVQERLPAA